MRAQLLHLSGPLRGRTVTYEARVVRIGSAPDCDAVVTAPGIAGKHVQIEFVQDECQFHLRKRDGQTFVNGAEVEEVILQDGDQIELGSGGPVVRFRIYVPAGAVCKPVRRMLADARAVAKVSGGAAGTQTFTRDLLKHATPQLKIGFPLVVVLVAGALAGWLGGLLGGRSESEIVTRAEMEELRQKQAEMAQQADPLREDLAKMRQDQAKQQEDLARLARANAAVRRIQQDWSRGVCLLHGIFRLKLSDGSWFSPEGDPFEVEYTGTGFLVTPAGHVVTNRHVVAPWLEMETVMRVVERGGATPEFTHLTATFPDKAPLDVPIASIARRSDALDVAVVQLPATAIAGIPVLPLREGAIDGDDRQAIVVGYPTGLRLLLARADETFVDGLRQRSASMTEAITALAASKQIEPTLTQGVISTVKESKIEYDAVTTHGGSGGPVFDSEGQVIAVNFAIMPDFVGSNFGVPIRYARELLPK
ncbi:MAG: trypsin-like peptidase domain-containing protein [Planctomycetota bacterium]